MSYFHPNLVHSLQYNLGLWVRMAWPAVLMCCPQAWDTKFPPLPAFWCPLLLAFHRVWQQWENTLTETPVQSWKLFHKSFKIHSVPTAIIRINCSLKHKELCYKESTTAWDCASPLQALERSLQSRYQDRANNGELCVRYCVPVSKLINTEWVNNFVFSLGYKDSVVFGQVTSGNIIKYFSNSASWRHILLLDSVYGLRWERRQKEL